MEIKYEISEKQAQVLQEILEIVNRTKPDVTKEDIAREALIAFLIQNKQRLVAQELGS
jgi:hypothetical protein